MKPATPDEWLTVLWRRAEQIEGQCLDVRTFGAFQTLQRQDAQQLTQGFRVDRGDPSARYTSQGERPATLQRLQAQDQAALHFGIDAALRELGDQNAARTTWYA
ncbi:hypothetical protein [Deinococcus sp. JMULE3]|uniref:hypothetical protein n=1 Tax=Deinococcus sp. JMULE3 TaxID=2518341 RepID=UPI0015767CCF|nr:hypothetical protein [Deinococcus sp. JMULE3]NTY02521.1 hypothetical protein [Deinococcus sp. JMULE3]